MGNKNNSSFTMHEPLIWNVYRITDTQSRGRCFARLPTYYAGHQLSRAIPKTSKKWFISFLSIYFWLDFPQNDITFQNFFPSCECYRQDCWQWEFYKSRKTGKSCLYRNCFHRYVCDIIVILQISIYRYLATNELDDRVRLHTGHRIIPQHLSSTVVVIHTIIGNSFSWYCLLYRLSTENKTIKNIIKKWEPSLKYMFWLLTITTK